MAFTVRPTTEMEGQLEIIKDTIGETTNSKAVKHVIENFMYYKTSYEQTRGQLHDAERRLREIEALIEERRKLKVMVEDFFLPEDRKRIIQKDRAAL